MKVLNPARISGTNFSAAVEVSASSATFSGSVARFAVSTSQSTPSSRMANSPLVRSVMGWPDASITET